MAPAQVVEPKELPPEFIAALGLVSPAGAGYAVAVAAGAQAGLATAFGAGPAAGLPAAGCGRPGCQRRCLHCRGGANTAAWRNAGEASTGRSRHMQVKPPPPTSWLADLEREPRRSDAGERQVWDALTRQLKASLNDTQLCLTCGRRIEAAQRLEIGRNTITGKILELGLDD